MKMQYHTIQSAEMKPDLYHGENCDGVNPQWEVGAEYEETEILDGNIILDPSVFPPGTRVLIQVPMCPECEMHAEYADNGICPCGFDWNKWRDNEYS